MCKVNVLMSTYNGAEHLSEQVVSIMEQTLPGVVLTVRDDGSADATLEVLKQLEALYPGRITVIAGENIGYRKSFLSLLSMAEPSDYYAYADQDDVWLPEKLETSVNELQRDGTCLYVSSLWITDGELHKKSKNTFPNYKPGLGSVLVRNRFPGCAMVFDERVRSLASKFLEQHPVPEEIPTHDALISACACVIGDTYVDSRPLLLHRRFAGSVSGGGQGLIKRIKVEARQVFGEKHTNYRIARFLLDYAGGSMTKADRALLTELVSYHKNRTARKRLLSDKRFSSGMRIADLEMKMKVWMGNY